MKKYYDEKSVDYDADNELVYFKGARSPTFRRNPMRWYWMRLEARASGPYLSQSEALRETRRLGAGRALPSNRLQKRDV